MSTRLLYHDNDHLTSFEATVVDVDDDARSVVLDATAFYPTGGHQRCDQGRITKDRKDYLIVTDVEMDDSGLVHHRYVASRGSIVPGDQVKGVIERDRRRHHMELHTAQHVFSRLAGDRFDVETGRADFSPDGGLVVMSSPLGWEQALVLEDDVNRLIREDRKVSRRIDETGVVTIAIESLDRNRCGGTHVASTAEIGMFKITRLQGKTVHYETGNHARRLSIRLANHAIETAALLGLKNTRDLMGTVTSLDDACKRADQRLEEWREETTQRQVSIAHRTAVRLGNNGAAVLQIDLSHLNAKIAKDLLKKGLTEENQVWLCVASRRNMLVSSAASAVVAREVVEEFVNKWGMRGGGNPGFAQGGPVPESVARPLDEVAHWILAQHATRD